MTRILAVTSGKGGVGKTHLSVNLALHCARKGQRVCLFDADLGLANVSLLFNLYPERNLSDVIAGTCRLRDIVLSSCGIDIVPGSSGVAGMADLPPAALARLGAEFSMLNQYDLLIFDTSAGVADNLMALVAAAPETLLVITPEPTALTDAYALVKLLQRRRYAGQLQVVVNQAVSERQARHTYEKFREVVRVYQGFDLPLLGAVPADPRVLDAARFQQPLVLLGPDSAAAVAFGDLAERLLATAPPVPFGSMPLNDFWSRLTGSELPAAAAPAQRAEIEAGTQPTTEAVVSVPLDLAERLTRLESGLATVVQELLHLRERPVQAAQPGLLEKAAIVEERRTAPSGPNPTVAATKPQTDRRSGRRAGEPIAPGRFVRTARRATPIDALQLRRVVGRMLAKAIPAAATDTGQPLQVAVDQMQLDVGNDFSLRPGRYTRFSLHCQHIESPDNFVEEIFENCAISGCKVRHLGSQARYWVTSGRDGCILLDGDDNDRHCVQVYMAAGGNSLLEEQGAGGDVPQVPALRRLKDGPANIPAGRALPATLLAKFPHQPVPYQDPEAEDLEIVRIMRRDRAPLLCAFHSADDTHAVDPVRRPSPERAF